MDVNKKRELRVGIISIVAILLLVLGISLGKSLRVPGTVTQVRFIFPNSSGIKSGAPIVVNGVERGKVTSIRNADGKVLIIGDISNIKDLKTDVSAKISMLEITGGKKIEISPGIADDSFDAKTPIYGTISPDIAELVAIAGNLGYDAQIILKRLDTITYQTQKWLEDDRVFDKVSNTLDNTVSLSSNLNDFANSNLPKLEIAVEDIRTLTRELKTAVATNSPKIDTIINKLDLAVSNANSLIFQADTAIQNTNLLIDDFRSITNDIKTGEGIVSDLLYNKELAERFRIALEELNEFVNIISEHGVNVNIRFGTRPKK